MFTTPSHPHKLHSCARQFLRIDAPPKKSRSNARTFRVPFGFGGPAPAVPSAVQSSDIARVRPFFARRNPTIQRSPPGSCRCEPACHFRDGLCPFYHAPLISVPRTSDCLMPFPPSRAHCSHTLPHISQRVKFALGNTAMVSDTNRASRHRSQSPVLREGCPQRLPPSPAEWFAAALRSPGGC